MINLKPIVTEKSISDQSKGVYQFWVSLTATKGQIASAFKEVFKHKPLSVRTLIVKGKTKQDYRRRQLIQKPDRKKAIVSIPSTSKIDLLTLKEK